MSSLTTRQRRQLLRRQRRQQRQQRQTSRRRTASPHLHRRVRSSDLHSLDERQRRMAQAILSRRHQAQQLLDNDPSPLEPNLFEPNSLSNQEDKGEPNPA